MRFYTYNVGAQLVRELDIAGAVKRIVHDGGDIIHLELLTGESLMVHLIESPIPLYEIRNIMEANNQRGDHTLFMLWGSLLLPSNGRIVEVEDWQAGLLEIYDGKIYAYDIHHQEVFLYPVYFQRIGATGRAKVHHGERIDVGAISSHYVETDLPNLKGHWRIAAFDGDPDFYHRQQARQLEQPLEQDVTEYYLLLHVDPDASMAEIKRAYRQLARQYHPDVNADDPDATKRMQNLNHAYNVILRMRTVD